ncbi:hypothetical protein PR048_015897 [Dryococelus australis]|uniref:Uncharacterized protein n=1 Tax=Dryococelus australis TaxID=614101 RepID=A0ABQ9HI72_9NEOP|nr:hypothetical protein PR048_015897 [Dryococelus australis]
MRRGLCWTVFLWQLRNSVDERKDSTEHCWKKQEILFDSGMGKALWGEALHTATYLLNRNPSVTVESTPAELWFGKKPDLSNLILFGALAYAKKLK